MNQAMRISEYAIFKLIDALKDSTTGLEWVDLLDSVGFKDVYKNWLPDIGKANGQLPSKKEYLRKRVPELNGTEELRVLFTRFLASKPQYAQVFANVIKDEGYRLLHQDDGRWCIVGGAVVKQKPVRAVYFC